MDSLTHLFYGGAIVAAIAPARHRRAALLAGAALNTLPDLDVLPLMFSDNPVVRMTWHRSVTHSWLVLPFVAWAIWAWLRSRGGRVAESPTRWWWAIFAGLMTHPLIDAFTVYGTQLLWPLPMRPIMWSSLFIIDPLFVLPFAIGCVVAWFAREKALAQRALVAGIALGIGYLGWSLLAKVQVERAAERALAAMDLANAPRFSTPAPFTTLRWRVVAMTPGGYVEGERGVFDAGPMAFVARHSDVTALQAVRDFPAVQRLSWFNHGFMRADVRDGELQLSDLRMGKEPHYAFRFGVAVRDGAGWRAISPVDASRRQTRQALRRLWRHWRGKRPDQAATASHGAVPEAKASK